MALLSRKQDRALRTPHTPASTLDQAQALAASALKEADHLAAEAEQLEPRCASLERARQALTGRLTEAHAELARLGARPAA